LVQNSNWRAVRAAADALNEKDLLTAAALARADEAVIAECVRPTGLQAQKAARLNALGEHVVVRFGTEAAFCAEVTRDQLLAIPRTGGETADRTLLSVGGRLVWPVDTYCLRVLAHHRVIPALPATPAEKRRVANEIKRLVEEQLPRQREDWQRLHALIQ